MPRTPVISSNIAAIGYDLSSRTMEIEFINSGIYRYADVPPETHADLLSAESIGRHFARHIKSAYAARRLEAVS